MYYLKRDFLAIFRRFAFLYYISIYNNLPKNISITNELSKEKVILNG